MNAQALFERYNRRYWKGRLPHYTVLVTDKYKGGRCARGRRVIYINPGTPMGVPRTLLHEMAHAATKDSHGKMWQNEIKRLIRMGAPLKGELDGYTSNKPINLAQTLGEFYDAGCEADDCVTWRDVRLRLGYEWGFVDNKGRAPDRTSARILQKGRREWLRGRALRKRLRKMREAHARAG
jgi:hypothetical protein